MSQMQQPRFVCEVIEDFEHYAVTCFREFGDKITSEPQVFDWWVEMGKRYLLS
jgi:beta-glucosidase/6-phospho-beta-glucosidase/beta-galactosidase